MKADQYSLRPIIMCGATARVGSTLPELKQLCRLSRALVQLSSDDARQERDSQVMALVKSALRHDRQWHVLPAPLPESFNAARLDDG